MQLFVDMDGVLADFDTGYQNLFHERPCKEVDNVDWQRVRAIPGFYANLPPMPDFEELWAAVAPHNPIILTGLPSSVEEALENKRAWVLRHIGADQRIIGCKSKEKCLHGSPGDVLIDDWEKYMHLWRGMGGHWITHISARNSAQLLSEYVLSKSS